MNISESSSSYLYYDEQRRNMVNASVKRGSVFMIIASAIGFVLAASYKAFGMEGPSGMGMILTGSAVVLAFIINYLARTNKLTRSSRIGISILTGLLPTMFFVGNWNYGAHASLTFLQGPVSHFYFLIIILSGFFFRPKLVLLTAAISAAGYFTAYLIAMNFADGITVNDPILQEDLSSPVVFGIKTIIIFLTGPVVVQFVKVARNMMFKMLDEERKRNETDKLLNEQVILNKKLEKAYAELKATQEELLKKERLAAVGRVSMEIAHEVQNPLNFVNNFSSINVELSDQLEKEIGEIGADEEVVLNLKTLKENSGTIHHHGNRASEIVTKLLVSVRKAEQGGS